MHSFNFTTSSPEETMRLGSHLARHLKPGDIICLYGDLGSGKTTFVKGVAKGLRIAQDAVNSPTFVLMNVYEGKLPVYHFDFYRLEDTKEIVALGYEEFLYGNGVAMIEWAERFGELLPAESLTVRFGINDENRILRFSANGKRYEQLLGELKKHESSGH